MYFLIGKAIDLWSVGIIIFMLLGGYHPFFEEGDSQNAMFKKIVSASYSFPEDTWEIISAEAKDLISRCLTLNPEKRITADEALRHPWLAKPSTELVAHNLNGTLVKLRHYRSLPFQKAGEFAANAAIDLVRKVSGANVGKNTSFKDGAIDVARKLSGTNLSEVAIEVARKASGVGIAAQRRPSGANIDVTRRPSGANIDISRKPSGANIDVIRKASGASAAKLAKSTSEARQNVRKGPANLAKENTGNSSPGTYSPTVSNPSTPAGSVSGSEKLGRFEGRITMDDTPEDENQVIKLSHMSGKEQGVRPALQLQSILQDVKKTPPANGKVQ